MSISCDRLRGQWVRALALCCMGILLLTPELSMAGDPPPAKEKPGAAANPNPKAKATPTKGPLRLCPDYLTYKSLEGVPKGSKVFVNSTNPGLVSGEYNAMHDILVINTHENNGDTEQSVDLNVDIWQAPKGYLRPSGSMKRYVVKVIVLPKKQCGEQSIIEHLGSPLPWTTPHDMGVPTGDLVGELVELCTGQMATKGVPTNFMDPRLAAIFTKKSSNPAVATVDVKTEGAKVTVEFKAVSAGTATVTVTERAVKKPPVSHTYVVQVKDCTEDEKKVLTPPIAPEGAIPWVPGGRASQRPG